MSVNLQILDWEQKIYTICIFIQSMQKKIMYPSQKIVILKLKMSGINYSNVKLLCFQVIWNKCIKQMWKLMIPEAE